jgi:threonine synthase
MKTPTVDASNLSKELNLQNLYLKREDQHEYGSHKGRSIPTMMMHYIRNDQRKFVVSSSGNAAIAAIRKTKEFNQNNEDEVQLKIFIGKKINQQKKELLAEEIGNTKNIELKQKERPKKEAFQTNKDNEDVVFLRQSTDEAAAFGYHELADELDQILNLKSVFVPTSSGTTAQGIKEGFKVLKQAPEIHIVQTEYCHPMAEEFDDHFSSQDEKSAADAIVDKVAHRKTQVVNAVKDSGGSGWIVSNEEIKQAQKLTKQKENIDISPNSALSIAGAKKAKENGWSWGGAVCCLICGR